MPVPKRKTSKSRRDKRQSCKFIRPKSVISCTNCDKALSPHQACGNCGFYKGKKVLVTKTERKLKRVDVRGKAKEAMLAKSKEKSETDETHDHDNHEGHKHE